MAKGRRGLTEVDWAALRQAATAAGERAYAPYSGLRVGAAALTDSGAVVSGCNVENASYGLTLCAECGLVSALAAAGGGRLVAVSCVAPDRDELLMPCGRCRQLLYEFGGPEVLLETDAGPRPLGELLPEAFGPDDL
jgi:cytidine deaminase